MNVCEGFLNGHRGFWCMAEGDIYLIRDLDLRTGQEIDYLKIGRTKPNESDERIAKHQTGNPRLITKKWDGVVPNDAAIEGHLHHYFSTDRVRGEWFWIDDDKLKNEVIPLVEKLIKEYEAHNANLEIHKKLKAQDDDGVERPPTKKEQALADALQQSMNDLEVAKKRHDVHNLNLRSMLGSRAGVEGIISLIANPGRASFDKNGFLATLSPAQLALCHHASKTVRKATASWEIKAESIEVLDPTLHAQHQAAKAAAPASFPATQLNGLTVQRDATVKAEHMLWMETRRDVKTNEWKVEQLKAQILVGLGSNKALHGIVSWPRYDETSTDVYDKKLVTEHFEVEMAPFVSVGKDGTKVSISTGKGYV